MATGKSLYTGLYLKDPSLLDFAHSRAEKLGFSFSSYIRNLIEKDQEGAVAWDAEIRRDLLEEKLNAILEGLGIQHKSHEAIKTVQIGENVSAEEAIDILTEEGIL